MPAIDSFAHVFAQAAERDLRLNNLCQMRDGSFRANWRRDRSERDGDSDFANCCESRDAFHALKDALAVAINTLPPAAPEPVKQVPPETDLFGGLF